MATPEQIRELTEKMAQQRAELIEQVSRLSDEDASRQPVGKTGEEEWTVKEQLAHLCEMELMYDAWVRGALDQDDPDVTGTVPPRAAIPLQEANTHSVAELLSVMEQERRDTLKLIAGLAPEQFERTATVTRFGRLTVMQWLRSFYRHDRMHLAQTAGRESTYQPRYAVGGEPNRRRSQTSPEGR